MPNRTDPSCAGKGIGLRRDNFLDRARRSSFHFDRVSSGRVGSQTLEPLFLTTALKCSGLPAAIRVDAAATATSAINPARWRLSAGAADSPLNKKKTRACRILFRRTAAL